MSEIRVRFAPSPTGYLHIGGARTALYNYLFARHEGGKFILRIEDTDRTRSTEEAINAILDGLKWLGIEWDEGPYFQSQRLELYQQAVEKLLSEGKAYYTEGEEKGRAVRFKMGTGIKEVDDLIHGKIKFDAALMEDFVIQKADGFPTYNFACVIDDHDMGITHVIRGDDHISNTPRQLALYEALGYEPPRYAHIPMILAKDGTRLSKRHGAPFVGVYRKEGYLSDAMVNFLALLGWSPGNDQEIISREELIEKFSLERVKKTSSRFNPEKLLWLNGVYIKNTPAEKLVELVKPFIEEAGFDTSAMSDEWLKELIELYHERFRTLKEFVEQTRFFFEEELSYDDALVNEYLRRDGVKELLTDAKNALSAASDFNPQTLESCLRSTCEARGAKFKELAQPLRVAITGRTVSAGLFEIISLMGREKVARRISKALEII